MSHLFAGPWVGEFGWELFGWQGYLRQISQTGRYQSITVASRTGHEVLYRDFMSDYVAYDPVGQATSGWNLGGALERFDYKAYVLKGHEVLRPGRFDLEPQSFIPFGRNLPGSRFDVVIHARSSTKGRTSVRNWPQNNWKRLLGDLKGGMPGLRVASIGTKVASWYIDGTEDLRGIALEQLVDVLASSTVCVGPSSGPMHLASLCHCPHVVWGQGAAAIENRHRYTVAWNPLRTPVRFIVEFGWSPPVKIVLDGVQEFLDGPK